MKAQFRRILYTLYLGLLVTLPFTAFADDDCTKCHAALTKGKILHAAMNNGCAICHNRVPSHTGASDKPIAAETLKAEQPDICLGQGCHRSEPFRRQYLHRPVASDKCTSCHNPHSSNEPGLLRAPQPDMCFLKCHEKSKTIIAKQQVHFPAAAKQCTFCHDPHSSGNNETLLTFDMPEMCYRCHDKASIADPLKNQHLHEPVKRGRCGGCHNSHATQNTKYYLTSNPPDICYSASCHDQAKYSSGLVHAPVQQGACMSCHTSHQSKEEALLQLKQPELCFKCHDRKNYQGGKQSHKPVAGGKCTTCHNPHNSKTKYLLKKSMLGLCADCHANEELSGKEKHGPFKVGMCNSCHAAHQSDNKSLLVAKSPDLCFICHSPEIFMGKYIHKPVEAGKCSECHGNHTTSNKNLLKRDVNETCKRCHESVFSTKHPNTPLPSDLRVKVRGYSTGHPYEKLEDPRRPGRTMSCVSCHSPHSSESKGLLRYKSENPSDLCKYCHS